MVLLCPPQQSLLDLCSIRIAYLMWTRLNLTRKSWIEVRLNFDQLVDEVLADVQNLPLPRELKSRILNIVKPAGKHLLGLMEFWLFNTQPENTQPWLTGEMLYECLILNADGLINERKTAEKILSSRKLNEIVAFRLACLNFFEKDVLKLWIVVKQWILNKLVEEGNLDSSSDVLSFRFLFLKRPSISERGGYIYREEYSDLPGFPCTRESDEVLFWISYCLSKENATDIKEVPHFIGNDVDWYEFSLESATYSGNVAWLEHFKNIFKSKFSYNYAEMTIGILRAQGQTPFQQFSLSCFIFHFMLLDSQEKTELFRKYPTLMMDHFLSWPLSQTFVENAEEIWDFIPDKHKSWVFLKIFSVLHHGNPLLYPLTDAHGLIFDGYVGRVRFSHSVEHLRKIWIALWEISSDSDKLIILELYVFKSIMVSKRDPEFQTCFEICGLKKKLELLFLLNGKAVLELYEGETMKESLRALVAKYIPDDFEDLDRRCISYLKTLSERSRIERKTETEEDILNYKRLEVKKKFPQPVHKDFLNYIKKCLRQLEISGMPLTKKRKLFVN